MLNKTKTSFGAFANQPDEKSLFREANHNISPHTILTVDAGHTPPPRMSYLDPKYDHVTSKSATQLDKYALDRLDGLPQRRRISQSSPAWDIAAQSETQSHTTITTNGANTCENPQTINANDIAVSSPRALPTGPPSDPSDSSSKLSLTLTNTASKSSITVAEDPSDVTTMTMHVSPGQGLSRLFRVLGRFFDFCAGT